MADYKGIYYNDDNKQRYFEGGAHFKYIHLYKKLEKLSAAQKMKMKREKLINTKEKKKEKLKKTKQVDQISKNIDNNINNVSIFKIIYSIIFF